MKPQIKFFSVFVILIALAVFAIPTMSVFAADGDPTVDAQAATPTPTPEVVTKTFSVSGGKSNDFYVGRGGFFTPVAANSGKVIITRSDPSAGVTGYSQMVTQKLVNTQKFLEVRWYDSNGKAIPSFRGLVYVYFNLSAYERKQWDRYDLGLYQYDEQAKKWVECPYTLYVTTKNLPDGRLSCITEKPGTYALFLKP